MSFDNSYYQNNLSYLFENNNAVYNIDGALLKYITFQGDGTARKNVGFESDVSPASFFKEVASVALYKESPADVAARMSAADSPSLPNLPHSSTFDQKDPAKDEVMVGITNGEVMDSTLLTAISAAIPEVTTSSYHSSMNAYMRSIINTVCSKRFKKSINLLSRCRDYVVNANKAINIKTPTNLVDALHLLTSLSETRIDMVMLAIDNQCAKSLKNILTAAKDIPVDIMSDFNSSETKTTFKRPLYYLLRTDIVSNLVLPPGILPDFDDNQVLELYYIYKILADIYIKTCYPLLHYNFMDYLMTTYMNAGDFVNTRIALLAKVLFSYAFVDYIQGHITSTDNNAYLATITSKLSNYLTDLNNIDVNSTPGVNQMSNIIKEVHQISTDVADKAQTLQSVKVDIENNQAVLRNLIVNFETAKRNYYRTVRWFWVQFYIILTVVIVCGVLLLLNKPKIAMNVAMGLAGVTGLLVVIVIIIAVIKLFSTN